MAKKWVERVIKILNEMSAHHVGAYAAQAAYFFMLSMIPIILLLLTMVQYTPVTKADVMTAVVQVFPSTELFLSPDTGDAVYGSVCDGYSSSAGSFCFWQFH